MRQDPLTWRLVVQESDDKLGPLLESLEEVDDQVTDVLGVGALEGKLLRPDRHQCKGLGKGLVTPENKR